MTLPDGGSSGPNMLNFASGWDDLRQDHGRPAAVEFAPDGRLFLGDDQQGAVVWIAPMGLMQQGGAARETRVPTPTPPGPHQR